MRWVLFIVFYLALGLYALQAIKVVSRLSWVYYLFIVISLLVLGNFVYQFTMSEAQGRVMNPAKSYAFGLLLTMIAFQLNNDYFSFFRRYFSNIFGFLWQIIWGE